MPTYQYACTACDERLEAVQSFTDAPLTECPACGGTLRKVFSAVGVVFKGSGFYKNDSRGSSGSADAKADGKADAKTDSKADAKSDSKGDSGGGKAAATTSSSSSKEGSSSSTPASAAPASKSA